MCQIHLNLKQNNLGEFNIHFFQIYLKKYLKYQIQILFFEKYLNTNIKYWAKYLNTLSNIYLTFEKSI